MKGFFWGGLLSVATRWQPLNNKFLTVFIIQIFFWKFYQTPLSESMFQNEIYKAFFFFKDNAYLCLTDFLIKIEVWEKIKL